MRLAVILVLGTVLSAGSASAQSTAAPAAPSKGYVEVVGQSAFSDVTSQSYGAEIGINISPALQIFAEAGQTRNVAPVALSDAAQKFAGGLSQVASNVGFTVKAPATFGAVGIKYLVPVQGKAVPYVLVGAGMASVKYDTVFTVGGTDVTSNLAQYGAVAGTDVSGSYTKPMFVVGGGVSYPIWQQVIVDLELRFGRIFAEDAAINVTRAGLGLGVRF